MRPLNAVIAVVLAAGALSTGVAAAQTPAGRVSGNALDQVGGLLPYVRVALTNRRSMARHEVRTDQAGHFEDDRVPPRTVNTGL